MTTHKFLSSKTKALVSLAAKSGLIKIGHSLWTNSLTVLNYHRIEDPFKKDIDSFLPNISASPKEFRNQMEYLKKWFNVVSIKDVSNWLTGKGSLPTHAALITFDDGYLDNYSNAYPILQEYGFPAIVYLSVGHIETDNPFYWDLVAYCFKYTNVDSFKFPDQTIHTWKNAEESLRLSKKFIEMMKLLPDSEKQIWISYLQKQLNVSIPNNTFRKLMMSWDQIREMNRNGIDFGGHTINHPILTRVSPSAAYNEIKGSKDKIEEELNCEIDSFAYPNGMKSDFNTEIQTIVAGSGYKTAFTLLNGPTALSEVKNNPYTIRRCFISHSHTLQQFSILVSPFNRLRS